MAISFFFVCFLCFLTLSIKSYFVYFTGLVIIPVLINVGLMLLLTLIVAATTLVERKILSLMQRRVGPQYVGYKGRLQYIADALKLFVKGALIPDESNKFWFITLPAIVAAICYSFWMNTLWGPSLCIFEIEYNVVFTSIFSALFTLCVVLTGYFSKNKYAMLAAIRAGIGMLNLELFLGLMFLNLTLITESFSFMNAVDYQQIFWLFIFFFGLGGLIAITFLLEVSRAPFDLSEAESELVAGYTVEYGGFFFGVYYLCEYLHLYFFSVVIATLFFGGWELPNFLYYFLMDTYFFLFSVDVVFTKNYYTDWALSVGKYFYIANITPIGILSLFASDYAELRNLKHMKTIASSIFQATTLWDFTLEFRYYTKILISYVRNFFKFFLIKTDSIFVIDNLSSIEINLVKIKTKLQRQIHFLTENCSYQESYFDGSDIFKIEKLGYRGTVMCRRSLDFDLLGYLNKTIIYDPDTSMYEIEQMLFNGCKISLKYLHETVVNNNLSVSPNGVIFKHVK